MESKQLSDEAEVLASRFIAQRETGPWHDEDAAKLEAWLSKSTLNKVVYFRFNAAWREAGRLTAFASVGSCKLAAAGEQTEDPTQQSSIHSESEIRLAVRATQPKHRPRLTLAASILALAGIAAFFQLKNTDRYNTPVGGLEAVPMKDGSRVTLNTYSTIKVAFDQHERRIELERGEAFFEVAKDKSRPFIVNVGGKSIIAVGTQFSVRREGDEIQINVTEGAVRYEDVSRAGSAVEEKLSNSQRSNELVARKQVLLPAGSMARTDHGNVLLKEAPIGVVEQSLTWRAGLLSFQETRLSDAVAEFNRYNTRKMVIRDPQIADIRIGGLFGANAIDPFVHLLESGFAISAVEQGDLIVLSVR